MFLTLIAKWLRLADWRQFYAISWVIYAIVCRNIDKVKRVHTLKASHVVPILVGI
jgi:hypothetical protein